MSRTFALPTQRILALLAIFAFTPALAAEVPVNAQDYNKLTSEQKAALVDSLKSSKLVGPNDTVTPLPGFKPAQPDTSKAAATPAAAACAAKCAADVANAKKACFFAIFVGSQAQCELIVDGVGAVTCMASC